MIMRFLRSALALVAVSQTAIADDTFTLRLGVLDQNASAQVASTLDGSPTNEIDLGDLGLDESEAVLWVDAVWHFSENWRLTFNYSNFSQTGSGVASFEFDFRNITVPVAANVDSSLETDIYILNVGYALVNRDNARLDVGLGIHLIEFQVEVDATTSLGLNLAKQTIDALAPLPNLLLAGTLDLGDKWTIGADLGWFGLDYGDYSGDLISARANIAFHPFETFGFGVGYQLIDMDLEVDESNRTDVYNLDFDGPVLFMEWRF